MKSARLFFSVKPNQYIVSNRRWFNQEKQKSDPKDDMNEKLEQIMKDIDKIINENEDDIAEPTQEQIRVRRMASEEDRYDKERSNFFSILFTSRVRTEEEINKEREEQEKIEMEENILEGFSLMDQNEALRILNLG